MTKAKRELTQAQQDRLAELTVEEMQKPIDWFKHDSNAHDDPAVARLLVLPEGLTYYGMYWLLIEHLAGRDRHVYSISDGGDWAVLARDLGLYPRAQEDMELCQRFIGTLVELGLIDANSYAQGYVESRRLSLNCSQVGRGRAARKVAASVTNEQRWKEKQK